MLSRRNVVSFLKMVLNAQNIELCCASDQKVLPGGSTNATFISDTQCPWPGEGRVRGLGREGSIKNKGSWRKREGALTSGQIEEKITN